LCFESTSVAQSKKSSVDDKQPRNYNKKSSLKDSNIKSETKASSTKADKSDSRKSELNIKEINNFIQDNVQNELNFEESMDSILINEDIKLSEYLDKLTDFREYYNITFLKLYLVFINSQITGR
jgi:hypothetical protein